MHKTISILTVILLLSLSCVNQYYNTDGPISITSSNLNGTWTCFLEASGIIESPFAITLELNKSNSRFHIVLFGNDTNVMTNYVGKWSVKNDTLLLYTIQTEFQDSVRNWVCNDSTNCLNGTTAMFLDITLFNNEEWYTNIRSFYPLLQLIGHTSQIYDLSIRFTRE